eukprot:3992202-Prymnesium_polylepis.1
MSPMTPATGPAASTTTINVQLELRGAHSRSSHAVFGWVGRSGLGWSAASPGGSEALVELLRR